MQLLIIIPNVRMKNILRDYSQTLVKMLSFLERGKKYLFLTFDFEFKFASLKKQINFLYFKSSKFQDSYQSDKDGDGPWPFNLGGWTEAKSPGKYPLARSQMGLTGNRSQFKTSARAILTNKMDLVGGLTLLEKGNLGE